MQSRGRTLSIGQSRCVRGRPQKRFTRRDARRPGIPAASQKCVAIFYFDLETVSRAGGESAIHAWAYATGTRQVDARTGCVYDFSHKAGEILAAGKFGPADWPATEAAERRWDAKVARKLILALPHELSLYRQIDLLAKYARWLRDAFGFAVEWAVHEAPGDPRNRHGHLVMTTRRVGNDGVHGKKFRELDVPKTSGPIVLYWRRRWELLTNSCLACARSDARIDHRSLAARGITRPPRQYMGQQQAAQHRAGYDTPAGKHNAAVDEIEKINAELARMNSRIRHFLALRRRERVKRQMRVARQRGRRRASEVGIAPAISDRREQPAPTPTAVPQGPAVPRRKTPRRR